MRVDWVIPCRFVEVTNGLATIVGAGIDTWLVPVLPSAVDVPLALRICGLPNTAKHDLEVGILGPSMDTVQEPMKAEFELQSAPGNPPGWEVQTLLPVRMQFMAEEEGSYTVNVAVDGVSRSIPIRIIVGTATP